MTRRLAAIFSLITLGAIATAPSAHAEVINVDFNGKVGPSCTTANVTNGKMALNNTDNKTLGSRADLTTGGQVGSFDLTCTGGVEISTTAPVAQGTTPNTDGQLTHLWDKTPTAFPAVGTGGLLARKGVAGDTGLATVTGPISNKTFYVEAAAFNSSTPVVNGDYNYRVTLNITAK